MTIRLAQVPELAPGSTVALDLGRGTPRFADTTLTRADQTMVDAACDALRPYCWNDSAAARLGQDPPAASIDALIGRGPGLTPAGDDALCGYVVAVGVQHPEAAGNVTQLISSALHRTSEPSASLLRAAITSGHTFEAGMRLLSHVLGGQREYLAADVRRLAQVGQTTGRAVLAGIVGGLRTPT